MNSTIEELKELGIGGIGAMFPNNLQTAVNKIEENDETMALAMAFMAKIEKSYDVANFIYYLAKLRKSIASDFIVNESLNEQKKRYKILLEDVYGIRVNGVYSDQLAMASGSLQLHNFVKSSKRTKIEALWESLSNEYNHNVSKIYHLTETIEKVNEDEAIKHQVLQLALNCSPLYRVVDGLTLHEGFGIYDEYSESYLTDEAIDTVVSDVIDYVDSQKIQKFSVDFCYGSDDEEEATLSLNDGICLVFNHEMSLDAIEEAITNEINKVNDWTSGLFICR